MHGGSKWNSAVNREQMTDEVAFLDKFVPFIIKIMMDNANELWGEPPYPLIEGG
jgi:hypothetical protein